MIARVALITGASQGWALELAYTEAHAGGHLWHEFGDSHLLLPEVER